MSPVINALASGSLSVRTMRLRRWSALFLGALAVMARLSGQTLSSPAQTILHTVEYYEGTFPQGPFVQADGYLVGSLGPVGSTDFGSFFRLSPDGKDYKVLHTLTLNEGRYPKALVLGSDGRFYGSCTGGGFRGNGTLFSMKRDGTDFVTLLTFDPATAGVAPSILLEGLDGKLYGVATAGGSKEVGTIFSIEKDGSGFVVLRHLSPADGDLPDAGLIQAPDGRLFGATVRGGANDKGTVFSLNPDGSAFTVLHHFASADGDGVKERLLLVGGRLYGTAPGGGSTQFGTVFRLNLDGSDFSVLKTFDGTFSGGAPYAGLTLASNGLIFGVTYGGGRSGGGALFRIRPSDGSFAVVADLGAQSQLHSQTLTWGSDQKLVGIGAAPGLLSAGRAAVIFSYNLAPQFTSAAAATGTVGRFMIYSLTAGGVISGYSATGLPTGLAIDPTDGTISGSPLQAGVFSVTVGATNEFATGTAKLTLTVAKGLAGVALSNLSQAYDGRPKPVTIVTNPAGLSTTSTYNGSAVVPTDPGLYEVRTTISDQNYTGSATANLSIVVGGPTISATTAPDVVLSGVSAKLTVTFGGSPPLTYRWQRQASGGSTFVDVADGAAFSGAATATLSVLAPTLAMNGDQFRCVVTNPQGSVTGSAVTLRVLPGSRLGNISIRASVAATQPMVVGFVTNAGSRRVLIRAIGPGLTQFLGAGAGVAGDPSLTLFNAAGGQAAVNDNWAGTAALSSAFTAVGAFSLPTTSLDAALLADVSGAYTAQMKTTATGIGLFELYDTGADSALRTVNFSTLYRVDTGANALVAGFVVSGAGPKTLLVRGIGPSLRAFGVGDALADAKLEMFDASSVRIATNDDWAADLSPAFAEVGAFALPAGSKDAAFVVTVQPGLYSVQLSTGDGVAGQGLIEVYELPR